MSDLTFAREVPADFRAVAEPIASDYATEMRHFAHALAPDWDAYQRGIASGVFHLYTVRVADTLKGLCLMIVRRSLIFDVILANQDLLWLHPDLRGQTVGTRFLLWCDQQVKDAGAQVIYRHTRLVKDFGPLLERLGYTAIDMAYGKETA